MSNPLTKKKILELFQQIDLELSKTDIHADLFVIGGAAMTVAYDARPSTRDVDGIWQPTQPIRDIIKMLAEEHGLETDWMNDAAKGFLPSVPDEHPVVIYDGDYFSVSSPSPQYLLATKILSSRPDRDEADIRFLIRLCGYSTLDDCLDVVERYYPHTPIQPKSQYAVEEILASMKSS